MTKAADLTQAREWCNSARRLLGKHALPLSDNAEMESRLKKFEVELKALIAAAKTNPRLLVHVKKIGDDYKALAGQARDIENNNRLTTDQKKERAKTVSEGITLLKSRVRQVMAEFKNDGKAKTKAEASVNKKKEPYDAKVYKQRKEDLNMVLADCETLLSSDAHRRLVAEIQGRINQLEKAGDMEAAAQAVLTEIDNVKKKMDDSGKEKQLWDAAKGRVTAVTTELNKYPDGSHPLSGLTNYQMARSTLSIAQQTADTARDYPGALAHLTEAEKTLEKFKTEVAKIEGIVAEYKKRKPATDKLLADTKSNLDELLAALPKNTKPAALGPTWAAYDELNHFCVEREKALTNFTGWGEHTLPWLDTLIQNLESEKATLDPLFTQPKGERAGAVKDKAKELADGFADRKKLEALDKRWSPVKEAVQRGLVLLEKTLGPLHEKCLEHAATFDTAAKDYAARAAAFPKQNAQERAASLVKMQEHLTTLLTLPTKMKEIADAQLGERATLAKEYERLRQEWNNAFRLWGELRTSNKYLDNLGNEWDAVVATYLHSENTESMRKGIAELQALLNRYKTVMQSSSGREVVTKCGDTFKKINDALNTSANKQLKNTLPTRWAGLKSACDTLSESGEVGRDDPGVVQPKLDKLWADVQAAQRDAATVADLRRQITDVQTAMEPLCVEANKKIKQAAATGVPGAAVPDNYANSFQSECALYVRSANSTEDIAKIQQLKTKVEGVKTKLEQFNALAPTKVKEQYDQTEKKHLVTAIQKNEQAEKDKADWEREWNKFTTQTYPNCETVVGQKWYSRLPGATDKMKTVRDKRDEAEKQAKAESYRAALDLLKIAAALATDLARSPQGSKTADTLKGCDKAWQTAATNIKKALGDLVKAIGDRCKDARPGGETAVVAKLQPPCKKLADTFVPDAFVEPVQTLIAGNTSDPRGVAEKALQDVRRYMKFVETDPLLRKLITNPFGVEIDTVALFRALRNLELNLLTVI